MEPSKKTDKAHQELQAAQINRALGVFLLFFSAVIGLSILFTDTTIGKLTNLAAGTIMGVVGGVLVYRARTKTP